MKLMLLASMVILCVRLDFMATNSFAQPTIEIEGEPASILKELNRLTETEKAAGWKLLFDGITFNGWRNYKKLDVSKGWQVIDWRPMPRGRIGR